MNYGHAKEALKAANDDAPRTEDYGKGVATIGGAAASGGLMSRFLPANSAFAQKHPTLRGSLYAGGLSAGGLLTRAGVDILRKPKAPSSEPVAVTKEGADMPPFLDQDRPTKVKEVYRALKRDHPEYSAEKKARIANSAGKEASVEYRGKTFPGYNQPIDSDRPEKKKMVLAKKGGQVKLIHFGQKGYKHNYSDAAKKNYLTRSAGIRGKDGSLTANDKFSANYWARRELWPKNEPADGSARNREKRAAAPEFGPSKGELAMLAAMPPAALLAAYASLPEQARKSIGKEFRDPRLYSNIRGALTGESAEERVAAHKHLRKDTTGVMSAMRAGVSREKRASDDSFGHKAELAGLGILAAPASAHLGTKVPGLRRAAKPLSEFLHKNPAIEHAVEVGGLGVLAAPSVRALMDKKSK